jgi:hypothetical protein
MGATLKQKTVVKCADGRVIILSEGDQISHEEGEVEFVCDSPRHEARFGNRNPLVWDHEAAKTDETSLPDDFYGIIGVLPNPLSTEKREFCSVGCLKDWVTYAYVRPKTAKERLAESRPDVDKNPAQMELPFPEEVDAKKN